MSTIIVFKKKTDFEFSEFATSDGIFNVKFIIKDFKVKTEIDLITEQSYEIIGNKILYEMEIERTNLQTIIKNSDGKFVRI